MTKRVTLAEVCEGLSSKEGFMNHRVVEDGKKFIPQHTSSAGWATYEKRNGKSNYRSSGSKVIKQYEYISVTYNRKSYAVQHCIDALVGMRLIELVG